MIHLDLFSGIGGFALAVDAVWDNVEHIFCEIDPYCRALLKKRFEGSVIYGDIREFTANTVRLRELQPQGGEQDERKWTCDLLTAGVPCQPASCAGKKRGTKDDRWLWPEAFRVIREFKPQWCILENVRGLLTLEKGLVFESLLIEMENIGYEVQPFIIPAVAVNAPHRRDRVWIVAHSRHRNGQGAQNNGEPEGQIPCPEDAIKSKRPNSNEGERITPDTKRDGYKERHQKTRGAERSGKQGRVLESEKEDITLSDSSNERLQRSQQADSSKGKESDDQFLHGCNREWGRNWLEVATELCGMDDGLPAELDGLKLSKAGHRVQRLKALGNAIVPQVAIEIFKMIKETDR